MQRKITNWREVLELMVDHWFEYNDRNQRVESYYIYEEYEKVEIQTSTRPHTFTFESMGTVLQSWKPIEHMDEPAFNHLEYARYDELPVKAADQQAGLPATTNKEGDPGMYKRLKDKATIMQVQHEQINGMVTNKIMELTKKIGTPAAGINTIRDLQTLLNVSKALTNQQMQELKDFLLLKSLIMPQGKVLDDNGNPINDTPDEKSDKKPDE